MSKEERGKKAPGVLLYDAWFLAFAYLSDEDAGRVLKSIGDHIQGFDVDLPDRLKKTTEHMFDQIDIDRAKYVSTCEQNSTNRKRPSTTVERPLTTVERPLTNSNSNNNSNNNTLSSEEDKEREYKRDSDKPNPSTPKPKPDRNKIPPDIEKVREYCQQRNSSVDPDYFFNYYEGQGWIKANGQKIKDWQATIRTWEESNKTKGNPTAPKPTQPAIEPMSVYLERKRREALANGNNNIHQPVGNLLTGLPESGQ